MIGVYKITHKQSALIYIGSSTNLHKRFIQHKSKLRIGKHRNKYLQFAYYKYGPEKFNYEVIELVNEQDLVSKEQLYILEYQFFSNKILLNIDKKICEKTIKVFKDTERFKKEIANLYLSL